MTPEEEARIRAEEREKIAAEIEAAAGDPLWPPLRMADALRSSTPDTDYVCVRREDYKQMLLCVAHVKGEGSDTYIRLHSFLKEDE